MRLTVGDYVLRFWGHQRWIPRGRDRILRLFSNPDTHPPVLFEIPFFGLKYTGNLANFLDWSVFYYGAYSRAELLLLRDVARRLNRPVNFFDVGANCGHHSLFMSQFADHVYAFEPFPTVATEYRRKMAHAGVRNCTLFPVALGDTDCVSQLSIPAGCNMGTATLTQDLPEAAGRETIDVPVARADRFFAENNFPPISILKMDVEGYEASVLEGMADRLRTDRPVILAEIFGSNRSGFADAGRFHALLYPDHTVFEVGSVRDDYRLLPFAFDRAAEVLVIPNELLNSLQLRGYEKAV